MTHQGATGEAQQKVLTLAELAAKTETLRREGHVVVHCHGVFDLLHIGHIRHFQSARQFGDVLVVTLTPDRFVNKGPDRPAFPEDLRAEAMAALGCVDFVAINRWPNAVETIHLLKPNVYAKGPDYRDAMQDRTGGIVLEEEAVNSVGGRLAITEDITHSSSHLINRYFSNLPPEGSAYVQELRSRHEVIRAVSFVEKLRKMKVLVVGETIQDQVVMCRTLGNAYFDSTPAVSQISAADKLLGAPAVAQFLAPFCKQVTLLSCLSSNMPYESLFDPAAWGRVQLRLVERPGHLTLVRRRLVAEETGQGLLNLIPTHPQPTAADMVSSPPSADDLRFCAALEQSLVNCDAVLVVDSGSGLISASARTLLSRCRAFVAVQGVPLEKRSLLPLLSGYEGAGCIWLPEWDLINITGPVTHSRSELQAAARRMRCQHLIVPQGNGGFWIHRDPDNGIQVPSLHATKVQDHDLRERVFGLGALCVAGGSPPDVTGFILAAASRQIQQSRQGAIDPLSLVKHIDHALK